MLERRFSVAKLSTLLVGQLVFFGVTRSRDRVPVLEAVTHLDSLAVPSPEGAPGSLKLRDADRYTALAAVSAHCPRCDSIAHQLAADLQRARPNVSVVLISSDKPGVAREYVDQHRWNTPLLHLDTSGGRTTERFVTARTPWLYLVDTKGTIVANTHAALLGETMESIVP